VQPHTAHLRAHGVSPCSQCAGWRVRGVDATVLYVSDDLKPPWIILQLFRHVIIKIPGLVTWPVAPSKDIQERCFTDPRVLEAERTNPLNFDSKPRLGSAYCLAMQAPEWMESRLKAVSCPFLIVHGDADVVTDPAVSRTLYEVSCSADKTLQMVEGAKHADCFWRKETYALVENWIAERV
jgi:alpha-beta hydrolase superfamily lysophospholipase